MNKNDQHILTVKMNNNDNSYISHGLLPMVYFQQSRVSCVFAFPFPPPADM